MIVEGADPKKPQVKLADFGISLLLAEAGVDPAAAIPAAVVSIGAGKEGDLEPLALAATTEFVTSPNLHAKTTDKSPRGDRTPTTARPAGAEGPQPSARGRELTQTGVIMGTPIYMAPELILGSKHAQPAADLFSLGVMAFEMLAGQTPFAQPAVLIRSLGGELTVPPLLRSCKGLDPRVVELIERCLAAEPERRPFARELAEALTTTPAA